jgi:hypothetical protein
MYNRGKLYSVSCVLLKVCTTGDDTANVKICQGSHEFKLISITHVVTDCTSIINNGLHSGGTQYKHNYLVIREF